MTLLARPRLVGVLQQALQSLGSVDAAWEGGSAAFGSLDRWSYIDAVVVADDAVEATIVRVEAVLCRPHWRSAMCDVRGQGAPG
jgi:predicted nucleotidyltransferase